MQAAIIYSVDYDGRAPLHGSDPYTLSGGYGPYPSAPYWDARLVPYTGGTYDRDIFSCDTVLKYRDRTEKEYARTFRMNLIVGG